MSVYSCVWLYASMLAQKTKEGIGYPSLSLCLFFFLNGRILAELGVSFASRRLEAASSNNPPISSLLGAGVKACYMGVGN